MPLVGATLSLFTALLARFDDALTASTFDKALGEPGVQVAFVKFFTPTCSHCREMAADWEELGEKLEDDTSTLIGSVDCDDASSKPVCNRFGINGLPALLYFMPPDARPEAYAGGRGLQALEEFVDALASAPCYPGRRASCNATQAAALEALESAGVEAARKRFAEIRAYSGATRGELEQAMMTLQDHATDDAARDKAKEDLKFADDVLKMIEERTGAEYRQLKAFLAPHGGTPSDQEFDPPKDLDFGADGAGGDAPPSGDRATKASKKKAKRKRRSSAGSAAPAKDEV